MKFDIKNLKEIIPSIVMAKEINDEGKHIVNFDPNFPISANVFSFKYDFRITPNYHDYLEIGYIIEGQGLLKVENKKYIVKKGDIVVLGNQELHTWVKYKNEGFIIIVIFLLPDLIFKPGGVGIDFEYLIPFLHRTENFNHVIHAENINSRIIFCSMKKIFELLHNKGNHYKLEAKTCLINILLKIVKHYEKSNLKPVRSYSKKIENINRLKDLIIMLQQEYTRAVTLEEAANKVNMSLHYFCKFFKKVIGYNFSRYLISIRIDKAKALLLTENLSVTNIAYKVGFENLSYFYRKFKEFTGLSPTEFKYKVKKTRSKTTTL
ncbi:MAG: AraC family transcriptional regulator [Actinobacteria bacterium]|nr:AraC family transcriptional regulator [Actinomycetota bacterium]